MTAMMQQDSHTKVTLVCPCVTIRSGVRIPAGGERYILAMASSLALTRVKTTVLEREVIETMEWRFVSGL